MLFALKKSPYINSDLKGFVEIGTKSFNEGSHQIWVHTSMTTINIHTIFKPLLWVGDLKTHISVEITTSIILRLHTTFSIGYIAYDGIGKKVKTLVNLSFSLVFKSNHRVYNIILLTIVKLCPRNLGLERPSHCVLQ